MVYKCPVCDYTAEEPGECPSCNEPLVEEEAGEIEE